MILLQPIVEIVVGAVQHIAAEDLADGTRIGVMPIGRHPLWDVTNHLECLPEEALGGISISLFARASNQPDSRLDRWLDRGSTNSLGL